MKKFGSEVELIGNSKKISQQMDFQLAKVECGPNGGR